MDINYRFTVEPEAGLMTDTDPEIQDHFRSRQNDGSNWAWCKITVFAEAESGGISFAGLASRRFASFRDEAEFTSGGAFLKMCTEAYLGLRVLR